MENHDIASQTLHDQWHRLVLGPLSKLGDNSFQTSLILVVDALDECDNEQDIRVIVQLLAVARLLGKVRLRVFITSRPDIPIRYGFYKIPEADYQDFVLHNISPADVDHDITIFLEHNFRMIRDERAISSDWPGNVVIQCLVHNASGLFIWAATACRFVYEGRRFAAKRLSMILQGEASSSAPERALSSIYITVLRNSVQHDYDGQEKEDLYQLMRRILGSIVVLLSPLSAASLARLLHTPREDVDLTLEDLHAILDIPKQRSRPIRLHHPSFRDFLLSKDRPGDAHFWVDEKQAHGVLTEYCIRLMSATLKRDISGMTAPGVFTTDLESGRVEQFLPPEVQYACLYWVQHLQRSGAHLYDNNQVHQFLREHLLHWFEALGWMQKTSEGILAITSLETIALVSLLTAHHKNFNLTYRLGQRMSHIVCSCP
jgi:hypothetical protein